jgi:hypothetical protein
MRRAVAFAVIPLAVALVSSTVSGAASRTSSSRQATDRVCANLIGLRNAHSFPPDRRWVWRIPNGCVFARDLARPAGCASDPELGCASPPDVHVRFQRRDYVFHLTLRGVPAIARGISQLGGTRQLVVTHDGRARTRQRLFIDFRAGEFDGLLPSGPSKGLPAPAPLLWWHISYTLDKKKGLCCPHRDAGSPDVSPFDVAPHRLSLATG